MTPIYSYIMYGFYIIYTNYNITWMFIHRNNCNLGKFLYNFSIFRLFYGPVDYEWTDPPVDLGGVLSILCQVHASEIFEHGNLLSLLT